MNTKEKGQIKFTRYSVPKERHREVMERLKELGYPIDTERGYALFFVSSSGVVDELKVIVEKLRSQVPIESLMHEVGSEAEMILRLSLVPFYDNYAVYITDKALTNVYRFSRDMGLRPN